MQHATTATFASLVREGTVFVEFSSPWCPPCRALAAALAEQCARRPELRVVQVNVDAEPALGLSHGVSSVPLLVAYRDGRPVDRDLGYRGPAGLVRFLDRVTAAVDRDQPRTTPSIARTPSKIPSTPQ